MARLVFTTIGSAGDLFPFLPIARLLRTRGHDVVFAANPWFGTVIESEGFPFHPMGPRLGPEEYATRPEIFDSARGGFPALQALMEHFILPHLSTVTEDLRTTVRGADLLLTHPAQLAAPMVAELERTPWLTLSVFPGNIPSAHTVPQGALVRARSGSMGRLSNRASWWGARLAMRFAFDRDLDVVRRRFGLGPAKDQFLFSGLSDRMVLLLCPAEYCEPPPDWPASIRCTGYTLFDAPSDWQPLSELERFLDAGASPVVVSLGTSVAMDAGSFVATAASALETVGQRGLFLVGQDSNLPERSDDGHAYFTYVPLSKILPRVRAIVHPGGFGTVAQAVTAGVPSVVVPRAFDQAYHGARLKALGLGRAVSWEGLSVARLADALTSTLSDEGLQARCDAFAARLAGQDGVRDAADQIEETLGKGH